MAAHFLLQIFQRFTQHIGHNANAGYHKQKVRHGFHLLSTEVLRNSVQPAATQWSAFHCRQTKLNHIYCCPSILFHTVNEHIQNFVQIPITGAADSFSHGYAVPDLRRFACLLPAQRAASSTPSRRELFGRVICRLSNKLCNARRDAHRAPVTEILKEYFSAQNKKKTGENSRKSEEICIKSPETLDRPFKKEYNTILHQYAQ